jgi:magnesium transporter
MAPALSAATLNDPVTQHMHQDFTQLRLGLTVGQALTALRERPPQERIIYFYVVDGDGRLHGVVPTRRLLLSPLDQPLAGIMINKVIAIPTAATVLDACEFFSLHRLLAFPVVDAERRLIGVVDVQLYTDELSELETSQGDQEDLFQLIGVHLTQVRQTSPVAAFRSRFPWLVCNLAAGILAALLSGLYQEQLGQVVALSLFIPAVLSLAESVSMQSVSLGLQAMHRKLTVGALLHQVRWESLTGLLLGGTAGLILGLVALVWLGQVRVTLCLLGGIAGGVTSAAVIGVAMPNVLHLVRHDPKVAAGPIALAVSDTLTLLLYFNCARWLWA